MQIHRRQIEAWSHELAAMAAARRKLIAAGLWQSGPSDFLGILQRERDEIAHNRMLAWLLDPTGRHGLGDSLLRQLLDALRSSGKACPVTDRPRVKTSFWRSGRQADIVVLGKQLHADQIDDERVKFYFRHEALDQGMGRDREGRPGVLAPFLRRSQGAPRRSPLPEFPR